MIYLRIMNHNHSWRTMVGFSLKEHAVFSPGRGRVDHRTIGRIRELPTTSSAPWDNISTQRWRLAEKNIQETQQKTAKLCKTGLQQWLEPNEMMWPSLTKKKTWEKAHVWPSFDSTARTLPRDRPGILRLLVVCSTVVLARGCLDRVFLDGDHPPREITNMSKHQRSYWSKHQRLHVWWESCNGFCNVFYEKSWDLMVLTDGKK